VRKVKVYRLVSKYTAEERIIEIATKKLLLEEIIINPINRFTKDDFSQIFKNSTWELFNKNLEEKDQEFTEDQISALLCRGDGVAESSNDPNVAERLNIVKNDLNDYYLSGFKFTSLNFETVEPQGEELDEEVK
jgi:chromodomain-helicase-DNA-binding protein 3